MPEAPFTPESYAGVSPLENFKCERANPEQILSQTQVVNPGK